MRHVISTPEECTRVALRFPPIAPSSGQCCGQAPTGTEATGGSSKGNRCQAHQGPGPRRTEFGTRSGQGHVGIASLTSGYRGAQQARPCMRRNGVVKGQRHPEPGDVTAMTEGCTCVQLCFIPTRVPAEQRGTRALDEHRQGKEAQMDYEKREGQ